jgi:hypothetical protein
VRSGLSYDRPLFHGRRRYVSSFNGVRRAETKLTILPMLDAG